MPVDGLETLFASSYEQLRRVAEHYLRERPPLTVVDPTVLVHEAFMKLAGADDPRTKTHFLALAARAMRQILVDFARRRDADKRGGPAGDRARISLSGIGMEVGARETDVLALDAALEELAAMNARHARVVEMRFFAGMDVPKVADALGVSERTVTLDWAAARAWLYARLNSA